jgi:hypothetical protein
VGAYWKTLKSKSDGAITRAGGNQGRPIIQGEGRPAETGQAQIHQIQIHHIEVRHIDIRSAQLQCAECDQVEKSEAETSGAAQGWKKDRGEPPGPDRALLLADAERLEDLDHA